MDYVQLVEKLDTYKLIGEGGHRAVYDVGNGLVLKVAIDYNTDIKDSMAVNLSEYHIYQNLSDKGFLCPSIWVSDDGMYLISMNAHFLDKRADTNQTEDDFIDYLVSLGCEKYDLNSSFNWVGHYLVDYGVLEIGRVIMECSE